MTLEQCRKEIAEYLGINANRGNWDVIEQRWIRNDWIVYRGKPYGYRINWSEVTSAGAGENS